MLINPNKQLVYGGFGALGYQPNYGSAGPYKLEIPQPCIEVNKTLQYEFRVLESVKDGEVTKIGLQVKTYEVDHNGNSVMLCDWIDVERVRLEV